MRRISVALAVAWLTAGCSSSGNAGPDTIEPPGPDAAPLPDSSADAPPRPDSRADRGPDAGDVGAGDLGADAGDVGAGDVGAADLGADAGDVGAADLGSDAAGLATSIYDITAGVVAENTAVLLSGVVVTAVDGYGAYTGDVFVQEPAGGAGSGIKLFNSTRADGGQIADLQPGDVVDVAGTVHYFEPASPFNDPQHPNKDHIKELYAPTITSVQPGAPAAPAVVSVQEIRDDPTAEGWESVLVRVDDLQVLTAASAQDGTFEVTGGLQIDDELYPHAPTIGDCISVTGISTYFYAYRLNPRAAADIQPGLGCP